MKQLQRLCCLCSKSATHSAKIMPIYGANLKPDSKTKDMVRMKERLGWKI